MRIRPRSPLWRRVARNLGRQLFRLAENNDDPRMTRNGEEWLLRTLLREHAENRAGETFVLVDGGANRGDYSRCALNIARAAGAVLDVHAFEPSPVCGAFLRREFAGEPAFRLVERAVGDQVGEALLHDGGSGSSLASLVPRAEHSRDGGAAIRVPVTRLDDYLTAGSISRVHLLKLDVEGHELSALHGLGAYLEPDRVEVIQFEYGGAAFDAGVSLRDLYRLLEARGYRMAKLFPAVVEWRSYRAWMEHYAYANFLALSPRRRSAPESK